MRQESVILLNQLEKLSSNVDLGPEDEEFIKDTFKKILEGGDNYNMHELENWFTNRDQKIEQQVLDRMMNIAHYQKSKIEASNKFRMVSDGGDCSCGGH